MHTTICKIGRQYELTVQHRELNSLAYMLSMLSSAIITYNRNESEKNMCMYMY